MKVLGFDPSLTNFGWAIHDPGASGQSRCPGRGRFQTSTKELFIERYTEMRESVIGLVSETGLTRVGLEFPIFNDIWSEGMYGLFLYACEALREAHCDVVFFSPGQIKAHARTFIERPKGWKMDKPDMIEAAKADTGGKGRWNHNEADAYGVAKAAARFWSLYDNVIKLEDLTPLERKQFTEIHQFVKGKRKGQTKVKGILFREDERFFCWSKEAKRGGRKEN